MKMMEVKITTEMLAEKLVASYRMSLTEFSTEREHNANCDAWRRLFGEDFYTEAVNIAKDMIVVDEVEPDTKCKRCPHCHGAPMVGDGRSMSQGFCDLLMAMVRLQGMCAETGRKGGEK